MEKIHNPDHFSATKSIDYQKYFQDFSIECNNKKFTCDDGVVKCRKILTEEFNLPLNIDELEQLDALCTIEKLKIHKENSKLPLTQYDPKSTAIEETHPITDECKNLFTVKYEMEFNKIINNRPGLLYGRSLGKKILHKKDEDGSVIDIEPGSTFMYKVIIYVPFNTAHLAQITADSFLNQYDIEILSTNTLTDLANAITCVSDTFVFKEVPDMNVDFTQLQNAKEEYPSRCFFIENVFYVDRSHPDSVDYSEVVRKWAIEKDIGVLKSESMEGVTLGSLQPRLGYSYVYIHQGNCQHILCFSDARLLQNGDCLDSSKFPRVTTTRLRANYLCFNCHRSVGSWLVVNSDRLPVRKAFFCTKCCKSYMFLDGKKVGDFKLFPYYTGAHASEDTTDEPDDNWDDLDEDE